MGTIRQRGVVVSPRFTFDGNTFTAQPPRSLDPLLRPYALYWDRIDFPDNRIISFGTTPDAQVLVDEGIMTRTMVEMPFAGNVGEGFVRAQFEAFRILESQQPGAWALAQEANNLYAPPGLFEASRSVMVELHDVLPVPSYETPLADVLAFKERRTDELRAFRGVMDELYQGIISSADVPHAKTAAVVRIETALADLSKATRESLGRQLLSSLKVQLHVPSVVANALAGGAFAASIGLNPLAGLAAGAMTGAVRFDLSNSARPNVSKETGAFAYVLGAVRELK